VDTPLFLGYCPCRLMATSHQPPTLITLIAQDLFFCLIGQCDVGSGWAQQKNISSNSSSVVAWCHCCNTVVFIVPSPSNKWCVWWHSVTCSSVVCKPIHGHGMSTKSLPINRCVYKSVSKWWPSMVASQFSLSIDMR
jgi:hypothetical protein